jgi:hypothetical protein
VHGQALLDDLTHRHSGRERPVGILEDDLHLAPQRAKGATAEAVDAPSAQLDLAAARLEPQQGEAEGCLA